MCVIVFTECSVRFLPLLAVSRDSVCGRNNRRKSLLFKPAQLHSCSRRQLWNTIDRPLGGRRHSGHKLWIPATDLRYILLLRLFHIRKKSKLLQTMQQLVWWLHLSLLPVSIYPWWISRSGFQCQWSSVTKQPLNQCRTAIKKKQPNINDVEHHHYIVIVIILFATSTTTQQRQQQQN